MLLPPGGDSTTRQSLAFFMHPDDEAVITGSDTYPPVKAGAYLKLRLAKSYERS